MPGLMRITSRDAFAEVLAEARARTRAYEPARWPLLRQIEDQLEFMAGATARGRVPHPDDRGRTGLGPLGVREFADTDPEYADWLGELDYTFARYDVLAPGPARRRRGILQVWSGREGFRKLVLVPGVARTVGTAEADFVVHGDRAGSPQFSVVWDGVCAHVQAIDPHRISVGGEPCWTGELANRGWMQAGRTTYRFLVEDFTQPPAPPNPGEAALRALAQLQGLRDAGTLYAIVDAARADRPLELVEESVDPYASLYDGEQGRAHDDVAPYLVRLGRGSGLLERLVGEGWGEAWGVFVVSGAEFEVVRRQLRRFLMIDLEGEAHRVFFRFYDPRVLQTVAPVLTADQRGDFLRHLEAVLYETPRALARLDHA
ncbi:DUF4123 domain-containing protein [Nannocystis bainbridge]|uniref:DUF4123 domain-containing protein n=1 Tax=Nannocystis bainbridge TaxID=2995303 RepID=A0ABT5DSD1_9BACT|nr:DUF4123 domain-containing protein [Nannocystis bainbridge]MDC0716451.1 DUF4123 domain-containing protein [Nannocystis bainbridge]